MQLCKYPFSEDLCKAKSLWKISYCLIYPINVHFHTLAILGHQISVVKSLIWWGGNVSDDSSFRDAFKNSRRISRFSYSYPNMTPNFSPLGNGNGMCCDGRGGLLWTECLYSPQHWNPTPQFDDFWKWGLREVTRSWGEGGSPRRWHCCSHTRPQRVLSPLPPGENTARGWLPVNQDANSHQNALSWTSQPPKMWEINVLFSHSVSGIFVTAACTV